MGQFDAALKHAITAHPADWARFLGVPECETVDAVDTDLSSIQHVVDKLLRIGREPKGLIHIEFQCSADADFDERQLFYHVAIRRREKLPVHSVVFVLVPAAWGRSNRGGVDHVSGLPGCRLDFSYQVVKVWELPPEAF